VTDFGFDSAELRQMLGKVSGPEGRVRINPETVEQDLARLVLGLMEFLRQLMELQAIRQMETGHLTPEQEEKLGTTLMRAQSALWDMAARFGLKPEDLALDLGPLGKTI
jgi:hypothetical protein